MKQFKFFFASILFLIQSLNAAYVTSETAKKVANNFWYQQTGTFASNPSIHLHQILGTTEQPSIYVFNIHTLNQLGFILVSGDDVARPILGYSTDDTFNFAKAPEHVQAWLADYQKSIQWAIDNRISATEDIKLAWQQLTNNKDLIGKRRGSVAPFLKATWNQVPYYNDLCPLDGNKRSVVGCVATAMAQVIHHWQYPTQGSGFHSYSHSSLGTISANFGNTTYNYANMPNRITSKNNDVALLNFHCGVAVEMNYSAQSSGAYVVSAASPVTHCAEYALKKYFSYPSTVSGLLRDNYSNSAWISKVNNDLDNGRPIIYAGFGNGGGHAFIFDGYDNTGKYHVNWGWGGAYNGYFEIDALNPDGLGTGGGTGSYNNGHQAIFGIEAPDNTQTDASISMYANITPSAAKVSYGQSFTITTNAANVSGKDFSGSLAIAVFDDSFNFVEFVGETNNVSLKDNYAFNSLTFESAGSLSMLPGDYHLYLCYKNNGGEWKIADDYSIYTNYAPLEIFYYSDIELYGDLKATPVKLKNTQAATVKFNVANTGSSTFRGTYAVSLFNMDGSFAQAIGSVSETNGLQVNNYYTNDLSVTVDAINVEPGTYLMAAQYQPSGSNNWYLIGSYYKVNPIKVVVEEAPIKADPYESNNDVTTAYEPSFTYFNENASWNSNITNLHIDGDVDFFRINFEENYDYMLQVNLSDINKSFNGSTYTLDARFSLSDDGVFWSQTFKNQINQALTFNGNDKKYLLIRVVPAFAGLLGDYDLNVQINRRSTASVADINSSINMYPNPATTHISIQGPSEISLSTYAIRSITGQLLQSGELNREHTIDISTLPNGILLLEVKHQEGSKTWKFVKE